MPFLCSNEGTMARISRPPVIAVMGHIDHGKSSLLDYIRKTNVAAGEAGGITQHVAAYSAEHDGRTITFLDTPGHEAFKSLRARGAQAADIAILVVAADEGFMPQTLDALQAIQEALIPYVVAITKIDKNNADIEHAKTSLLSNEVYLEGLGGDIPYALVSSKTGEGVPELLDLVLLAADLIELSADPELPAEGFVLESTQDPKRGSSATLIIKDGTLVTGTFVVATDAYAPVRFIENFLGKRILSAGPSEPVLVSGFSKLPEAGALFTISKTKKEAEHEATAHAEKQAVQERTQATEGIAVLPLIIKADVQGSVDAIKHELKKLTHERAEISIVGSGVGSVSESDVKTALASGATIIAFNTGTDALARDLSIRDSIDVENFSIIYELGDKVAELLAGRAPKITVEEELGRATVLRTFGSTAKRQVMGATLLSGAFAVGNQVKVMRTDEEVTRGKIANLQQQRADVKEIRAEGEFGLEIEAKEDVKQGDTLIVFIRAQN